MDTAAFIIPQPVNLAFELPCLDLLRSRYDPSLEHLSLLRSLLYTLQLNLITPLQLCPDLIFVPVDFKKSVRLSVSRAAHLILALHS